MLNQEQVASFERDGFVHGGSLLSVQQIRELRDELDRLIQQHDRGHADQVYIDDTAAFCQRRDCFLQVSNTRELSDVFAQRVTDPELVARAAQLLGSDDLRIFGDSILYKNGRDSGMNDWHQDGRCFDILHEPEKVLTAWMALDDVGKDDGCVCFASGSHRWSDPLQQQLHRVQDLLKHHIEEIDQADAPLRAALVKAGDVHFHHGLTWHCSLNNRTGRDRRGFVVHYLRAEARFNAAGSMFFKRFVEVGDGQPFAGRHFPRVAIRQPAMS